MENNVTPVFSKKEEDSRETEMSCINSESCGVNCMCDSYRDVISKRKAGSQCI